MKQAIFNDSLGRPLKLSKQDLAHLILARCAMSNLLLERDDKPGHMIINRDTLLWLPWWI